MCSLYVTGCVAGDQCAEDRSDGVDVRILYGLHHVRHGLSHHFHPVGADH